MDAATKCRAGCEARWAAPGAVHTTAQEAAPSLPGDGLRRVRKVRGEGPVGAPAVAEVVRGPTLGRFYS